MYLQIILYYCDVNNKYFNIKYRYNVILSNPNHSSDMQEKLFGLKHYQSSGNLTMPGCNRTNITNVRFYVPTEASEKTAVFWVNASWYLAGVYRRFRSNCCIIAPMMETADIFETSVKFYQILRRKNQQESYDIFMILSWWTVLENSEESSLEVTSIDLNCT